MRANYLTTQVNKANAEKENKLKNLVKELESTDYKVIKCYEYSLVGEELPYDIGVLHAKRQSIRDEINVAEKATL